MNRALPLAVVAGICTVLTAMGAQALPVTASKHFGVTSNVTQVAGGCGAGWYRGPFGVCLAQWRPRVGMYGCWFRLTPAGP